MENHFCKIHGCQMEERDYEGLNKIGNKYFVCIVCEEEGLIYNESNKKDS